VKLSLRQLRGRQVQRLIIESVDLSLYIAQAEIDGECFLLTDEQGRALRSHNLLGMKERLRDVEADQRVLRQRSAYDEMVGSAGGGDNLLEVPLGPGFESLPRWEH
jgi:hypothetical protein